MATHSGILFFFFFLPLQYSCLENSMDRGAWRATVHGVTESDTTKATYLCARSYCRHRAISCEKTESLPSWCSPSSGIRPSVKIILMKCTICQVVIDVRKHQDKG